MSPNAIGPIPFGHLDLSNVLHGLALHRSNIERFVIGNESVLGPSEAYDAAVAHGLVLRLLDLS